MGKGPDQRHRQQPKHHTLQLKHPQNLRPSGAHGAQDGFTGDCCGGTPPCCVNAGIGRFWLHKKMAEVASILSQDAILSSMIQSLRSTQPKANGIAQTAVTGVSSGFPDLDQLTGGFQPGQLIFVASRYSMGKTALAFSTVIHVAISDDLPVVVFCLASCAFSLKMRLASSISGICLRDIQTNQFSSEHYHYLNSANKALEDSKLHIDANVRVSLKALSERVRWLAHEHGNLGLIVVDDLQCTYISANRGKALASELGALSHGLKLLAQEHCCPVIVTTQLGRRMEMRRDKRPRLKDLRAGGRLEQAADLIITVYRDDYYNHDASHSPNVAEISVVKHLNGTTGFVVLAFNKSLTKFENLTKNY
jgi:replicative DNA helicase